MDIEELVLRIRVMAEQADVSIDDVKAGLEKLDTANQKSADVAKQAGQQAEHAYKQQGQSAEAAAAQQMAAYAAVAAAAMQAFRVVVGAIQTGIDANNQYVASMQGLQSVASGRGIGGDAMEAALSQLTDAFFDTTAAATSLKNLLSRGYSLDQAVQTITRLKDAAAFGRQAHLEFAQAVVTATEGLKNEVSANVDNAGVTKNVAKMHEEYAKSIGVAVTSLTQAQKVQAEYQGIMEETRFQVGDLAKLTDTLAGSQAEAAMSGELLSRSFGESMAPTVGLVTEVWSGFLTGVRGAVDTFPDLTAGATASTTAILGFVTIGSAISALKKFHASLLLAAEGTRILGMSVPVIGWIVAGIGAAAAVYTAFTRSQEAAAKAAEEAAQKLKEEQQTRQDTANDLQTLGDRYEALNKKKRLSYSDTRELRSIEQQLAEKYVITADALGNLAGAYDTVTAAIRNKRAETLADMQETMRANLNTAKEVQAARSEEANTARQNASALEVLGAAYDTLTDAQKANTNTLLTSVKSAMLRMLPADNALYMRSAKLLDTHFRGFLTNFSGQLAILRGDLKATLDAEQSAMVNSAMAAMNLVDNSLEAIDVPALFKAKMREVIESLDFSGGFEADSFMQKYADVLKNADVAPALAAMEEMNSKIMAGITLSDADQQKYMKAYESLYQALIGSEETGLLPSYEGQWRDFFDSITLGIYAADDAVKKGKTTWDVFWASIKQNSLEAIKALTDMEKQAGMAELQTQIDGVADGYASVAERVKDIETAMAALQNIQSAGAKGTPFSVEQVQAWAQTVYESTGVVVKGYADVTRAQQDLSIMSAAASADWTQQVLAQNAAETAIRNWISALTEQRDALDTTGQEYQNIAGQIDTLTSMLTEMSNAASSIGVSFSTGTGTGGNAFDAWTASAADFQTQVDEIGRRATTLSKRMDSLNAEISKVDGYKKAIAEAKKLGAQTDASEAAFKALGIAVGNTPQDFDKAAKAANDLGNSLTQQFSDAQTEAEALQSGLQGLDAVARVRGDVEINTSSALSAIASLFAKLTGLSALLDALGWGAGKKIRWRRRRKPFRKRYCCHGTRCRNGASLPGGAAGQAGGAAKKVYQQKGQ